MASRERVPDQLKKFGSNVGFDCLVPGWVEENDVSVIFLPLSSPRLFKFKGVVVTTVVERCLVVSFCLVKFPSCARNAGQSFVDGLWDSSGDARWVVGQFVDVKRLVVWLPVWFKNFLFQVKGHIKEIDRREVWFFNGNFQAVPSEESMKLFLDLFHSASW